MQRKENKIKVSTIDSWKSDFPWLLVKSETLFCRICISQKSIIELEKYCNPAFTYGSTRLKQSVLADHEESACHIRTVKEKEHKDGQRAGQSLQAKKVTIEVPSDAPIKRGLDKMMSTEKEDLRKLFNMVYYIRKGRPYTDFEDLVNLQVLNGAEFRLSSYVNKEACRDFIQNIADFSFDEEIAKKLRKVNFIGLL